MYRAPLRELRFVIEELLRAAQLASFSGLAEYSDELAASVLEEAARFAQSVLDPLNKPGDTEGARWTPEGVVTAPGFRDAYQQFAAAGWSQLGSPPQYGGQLAPQILATAVQEFWRMYYAPNNAVVCISGDASARPILTEQRNCA